MFCSCVQDTWNAFSSSPGCFILIYKTHEMLFLAHLNVLFLCTRHMKCFFYVTWMFYSHVQDTWMLFLAHLDVLFSCTRHMKCFFYVTWMFCSRVQVRAPYNFQVQRVITPYFWKWCVFAYFLCTVVLSTSEKIAYM